jgi:hypothetical protein
MKFRTDITKGGYKILSIHGPDGCEEYAGVIETEGKTEVESPKRFYVVSEEELESLYEVGWSVGYDSGAHNQRSVDDFETLTQINAACRSREVRPERVSIRLGQMLDAWVAADYKEPDPELYRNRQRKPRT